MYDDEYFNNREIVNEHASVQDGLYFSPLVYSLETKYSCLIKNNTPRGDNFLSLQQKLAWYAKDAFAAGTIGFCAGYMVEKAAGYFYRNYPRVQH